MLDALAEILTDNQACERAEAPPRSAESCEEILDVPPTTSYTDMTEVLIQKNFEILTAFEGSLR